MTTGGRTLLVVALGGAVVALAAIGVASWRGVARPPPRELTPVELRAAAWRAGGLQPSGSAEAHLAAGREAQRADLPAKDVEARDHFQQALALEPGRLDALAAYLDGFAAGLGTEPDAEELREVHRLASWGLERAPGRADLLVGWAHLLLAVPSEQNAAEALGAAQRAVASGGGAEALLAEAQARLLRDPAGAAEVALRALEAAPTDRRPLMVAAQARWKSGDARGALQLVERRLAADPGHPGALSLRARIEATMGRADLARATLRRWVAAAPRSAEPLVEQALVAYQLDGDLAEGRRLLDRARALPADDFQRARILAHLAAVERTGGNAAAARRLVAQALARVPASGPARYQEALLDFARGDAAAHRLAAGVVGRRGGERVARILEARTQEVSGRGEEAIAAWEAMAASAPRDLGLQLEAAGALVRLRAPGRAVPLLARAAALDPDPARGRGQIGDYWEGPAALAQAARELESMAVEEPVAARALAAAASCELLLGRPGAAEALARRALERGPQLARAQVVSAQAWLERGRPGEALRAAGLALEGEPANAAALVVRARALEASGRFAEAAEAHRLALQADPAMTGARLGLARRMLREGQKDKGLAALRQLLAEDPDDARVRAAALDAGGPAPGR